MENGNSYTPLHNPFYKLRFTFILFFIFSLTYKDSCLFVMDWAPYGYWTLMFCQVIYLADCCVPDLQKINCFFYAPSILFFFFFLQRPKFLRSRVNYQAINVDTLRAQNMESFPTFNQVFFTNLFLISSVFH